MGALGCTGLVRGGSPAAGQCVPYMPGTGAAGAGPCGGGAHGMGCVGALAEPPDGLPPEQLLEQAPGFDFATLCDFERPAAVP